MYRLSGFMALLLGATLVAGQASAEAEDNEARLQESIG